MIKKEEYTRRIAKADKGQLVAIHFDLIIDYLNEAKENIENEKLFTVNLQKSRDFLKEMKLSLNMECDISKDYYDAYNYIDRLLCKYLFNKSEIYYNAAIELLNKFSVAWKNINEKTEPVMTNTETMYAGLTYDKNGQLNEYVDLQTNRGFKA